MIADDPRAVRYQQILTDEVICSAVDEVLEANMTHGGYEPARTPANLEAMRDVLVRALVAAPEPTWQPIETAPKDGTEILLLCGRSKRTGYWARRIERWVIDAVVSLPKATHWMPLPTAPAPAEEARR